MIIQSLALLTTLSNFRAKLPNKRKRASISVLIPARDEAQRISRTLEALGEIDLEMEILVLDDNSKDGTAEIVGEFSRTDPRIRLVKGLPLPQGWAGKNWACHQLAKQARGDFFLFLDADMIIRQDVIEKMIAVEADIVSCFPGQAYKSLNNYLVDTLPYWQVATFISLPLANRLRDPTYCAASGQCLMIKASSYNGFHERLKLNLVEDIYMARLAKKEGLVVKTYLCTDGLDTLPYQTFSDGMAAFKKNYFPSYPNTASFLFFQVLIFASFVMPLVLMWFYSYFIVSTGLIMLQRFFQARVARQSPISVVLHPIQMVLWHYIALASYLATRKGNREWKGRKY